MYLRVEVMPGAKKESLKKDGEKWRISVREPAEQNRANKRVCELIAYELSVSVAQVRILTGHHARGKMISIDV